MPSAPPSRYAPVSGCPECGGNPGQTKQRARHEQRDAVVPGVAETLNIERRRPHEVARTVVDGGEAGPRIGRLPEITIRLDELQRFLIPPRRPGELFLRQGGIAEDEKCEPGVPNRVRHTVDQSMQEAMRLAEQLFRLPVLAPPVGEQASVVQGSADQQRVPQPCESARLSVM